MSGGDFYAAPKIVTVRKAHECAYCGETIPAGTRSVLMESGLWMVCSGSATHVRAVSHMSVSFGAGKAWRAKTSNGISTSSCGRITAMCG